MPPKRKAASTNLAKKHSTIGNRHAGTAQHMADMNRLAAELAQIRAKLQLAAAENTSLIERHTNYMQRTRGLVEDAQLLAQLSIDKQKMMTGAVAAAEQLKVFAKMLESCTETVDKQLKTVADNKDSDLAELADDVTTIFSNIRKFIRETMSADGPAERIKNAALRKDLASALTKIEALQDKKGALRLLCIGFSQVRLDDYKAIGGIEAPTGEIKASDTTSCLVYTSIRNLHSEVQQLRKKCVEVQDEPDTKQSEIDMLEESQERHKQQLEKKDEMILNASKMGQDVFREALESQKVQELTQKIRELEAERDNANQTANDAQDKEWAMRNHAFDLQIKLNNQRSEIAALRDRTAAKIEQAQNRIESGANDQIAIKTHEAEVAKKMAELEKAEKLNAQLERDQMLERMDVLVEEKKALNEQIETLKLQHEGEIKSLKKEYDAKIESEKRAFEQRLKSERDAAAGALKMEKLRLEAKVAQEQQTIREMEKAGGQSDELATVRINQLQEKLDAAEESRKASETAEQDAKRREQEAT